MSDETASNASSVPSAEDTSVDESTTTAASEHDSSQPPLPVIVDRSSDEDSKDKAVDLKNRGNEQLLAGHYLEAIGLYTQALEFDPTSAIILSNRAQAFIKVENYGLAMADATAAIQSDPNYAKGYYRRGTAQFALTHLKDARKDFRQVCKLKPKDKDARSKLQACEKAIKQEAFRKAIESEFTAPLSATYDVASNTIPSTYDGPHPSEDGNVLPSHQQEEEEALFRAGNLPRRFVMDSIQRFKEQKLIHQRYVARILLACKDFFESSPSLMEISIPTEPPEDFPTKEPRITVCGDTHGQYYDVLNIFEINGFPSRNNPYLFNGDFVDRGSFSVEVILTFLMFKLSDPDCIFLTRGNHETKNMNKIYGFEGEVKAKYDDKIFELFLEVFGHLPLAATIQNKIFVTHGGLPTDENVTLADIQNIKRGMEPPETGLMSDLLWSDPQPFLGKSPSKRGVGYAFGPDITANFLQRNDLTLLVRSHEVKEEGYVVEHAGKTITVFSAPNYCDTMGNKGAFIHFENHDDLEPKFTKFTHVPHPDIKPMAFAAGMGGLFA